MQNKKISYVTIEIFIWDIYERAIINIILILNLINFTLFNFKLQNK